MHSQTLTQLAPEEANERRAFVHDAPSSKTSHKHDSTDHEERQDHVTHNQNGCPERQLEDHAANIVRACCKQADDDLAASPPRQCLCGCPARSRSRRDDLRSVRWSDTAVCADAAIGLFAF